MPLKKEDNRQFYIGVFLFQICANLKKTNIQTFSYGQDLTFESYVQYMDYISFVKAMDSLRGMKLLYKGEDKALTAIIKVKSHLPKI